MRRALLLSVVVICGASGELLRSPAQAIEAGGIEHEENSPARRLLTARKSRRRLGWPGCGERCKLTISKVKCTKLPDEDSWPRRVSDPQVYVFKLVNHNDHKMSIKATDYNGPEIENTLNPDWTNMYSGTLPFDNTEVWFEIWDNDDSSGGDHDHITTVTLDINQPSATVTSGYCAVTYSVSNLPTYAPTPAPTNAPTPLPSALPTSSPTASPTAAPTTGPTTSPTTSPTQDEHCGAHPRCVSQNITTGLCCPRLGGTTYMACCDNTEGPTAWPTQSPTLLPQTTAGPTASPTAQPTPVAAANNNGDGAGTGGGSSSRGSGNAPRGAKKADGAGSKVGSGTVAGLIGGGVVVVAVAAAVCHQRRNKTRGRARMEPPPSHGDTIIWAGRGRGPGLGHSDRFDSPGSHVSMTKGEWLRAQHVHAAADDGGGAAGDIELAPIAQVVSQDSFQQQDTFADGEIMEVDGIKVELHRSTADTGGGSGGGGGGGGSEGGGGGGCAKGVSAPPLFTATPVAAAGGGGGEEASYVARQRDAAQQWQRRPSLNRGESLEEKEGQTPRLSDKKHIALGGLGSPPTPTAEPAEDEMQGGDTPTWAALERQVSAASSAASHEEQQEAEYLRKAAAPGDAATSSSDSKQEGYKAARPVSMSLANWAAEHGVASGASGEGGEGEAAEGGNGGRPRTFAELQAKRAARGSHTGGARARGESASAGAAEAPRLPPRRARGSGPGLGKEFRPRVVVADDDEEEADDGAGGGGALALT